MTIESLCKEVLELDEKATPAGIWPYVSSERKLFRTSAPKLARACLKMAKALEQYTLSIYISKDATLAAMTLVEVEKILGGE